VPWLARRTLWHSVGVLVVLALAWLILQGYRQPDLILELSSLRFC